MTSQAIADLPTFEHTAPDPFVFHETLALLKEKGITHVALEASSHGIHQHRLDAVDICAAGFTNLSQDHLDYHETMDHYLDAKRELFTRLLPSGETAVLNEDTNFFHELERDSSARGHNIIPYGKRASRGSSLMKSR